jgi:hypothetical protein
MTECILYTRTIGRGEVLTYCSRHHCAAPDGRCPEALSEKVRDLEARIAKLEAGLFELANRVPLTIASTFNKRG